MEDVALFGKINALLKEGTPVALATVTATRGSAPQVPGAKMAVLADGRCFGTVGGGCVEGTVRSACLEALLKTREVRAVEVSLTDDAGTREGDICGGTMEVLVEPLLPQS